MSDMSKVKIGILTFHRTSNFGSTLQAEALCEEIKQMGYKCMLIDYRCKIVESREHIRFQLQKLKSVRGIKEISCMPYSLRRYKSFLEFYKRRDIEFSKSLSRSQMAEANTFCDIVLVGSDLVWSIDITQNDKTFLLDFADDNKPKISYGSSIGDLDRIDIDCFSKSIRRLKYVNVREQDATEWINGSVGIKARHVCDPTMFFCSDEWDRIISDVRLTIKIPDKYVLIYFYDDNRKAIKDAKNYATKHNLKVILINLKARKIQGVENIRPVTLKDFIELIKKAEYIFTASYHGLLFSLYYNKPFVFYSRSHSTRMTSIAQKLGVSGRCADEQTYEGFEQEIDYEHVNELISNFRKHSRDILRESIENCIGNRHDGNK